MSLIRIVDFLISLLGIAILSPLFLLICLIIWIYDRESPFFLQSRVGKEGKTFKIVKFRSMTTSNSGPLISTSNDSRITPVGKLLRKYKIDELPQLFNVFAGQMSLVGPRPEVEKYVRLYNPKQQRVLSVKPGITDYASVIYRNENEIIEKYENPEKAYVEIVMPRKIRLNQIWVTNRNIKTYFHCIYLTIQSIISS